MYRVHVSTVIDAPVGKVWDRIRDYNDLPSWVPAITKSEIEEGRDSSAVGCVRALTLENGAVIRERLLGLSDHDHLCTYTMIETPLPLQNYVATLRLSPITDGDRTLASWSAEFDTDQEEAMRDLVTNGVFMSAFDSLKKIFSS